MDCLILDVVDEVVKGDEAEGFLLEEDEYLIKVLEVLYWKG